MIRPYAKPMPEGCDLRALIADVVPRLETDRLILRAPRAEDFDTLAEIWRTDRGQFIGGPFDEEAAWLDFAQCVAGWVLWGAGYWTVVQKSDSTVVGLVGFGWEVTDAERELGWLFVKEAEGKGLAFEASQAALDYAFGTLGLRTLISSVDKANVRSIALAKRLGATEDPQAVLPQYRDEDTAYRHLSGAAA